jgi:hypothetical protein
MRPALVAWFALAAAVLAVRAGAAAAPPTIPNCFAQAVEPAAMTIACGDGNLALENVSWQDWGGDTASGSGTMRTNNCETNCAAGVFYTYAVDLTASGLKTCLSGRRQYTHLEWSAPGKAAPGQANLPGEVDLPCSWRLHPDLSAARRAGKVVVSGKAWPGEAGCPAKVTLTSDGRRLATVPLTAKGTFAYSWRAPTGRQVVVARQTCGKQTLFEASLVVR